MYREFNISQYTSVGAAFESEYFALCSRPEAAPTVHYKNFHRRRGSL